MKGESDEDRVMMILTNVMAVSLVTIIAKLMMMKIE